MAKIFYLINGFFIRKIFALLSREIEKYLLEKLQKLGSIPKV